MFSALKKLFGSDEKPTALNLSEYETPKDDDLDWLFPPRDVNDVAAWDRYFSDHVENGIGPPFFDMFSRIPGLVYAAQQGEMNTVLCAGNGICQEPRALAGAGFAVTALDHSPFATEYARNYEMDPENFGHFYPPEMCREGGRVEFITGDLRDPSVAPGPFDIVIERRTVQLFPKDERDAVLSALTTRLSANGIFVSHSHDGCWKPPRSPIHATENWFRNNRWRRWEADAEPKPAGRVVWIVMTTG